MRQFESPEGLVGDFAVVAVRSLDLEPDGRLAFVQFATFGRVLVLTDLAVHAEVEQRLQLGLDRGLLTHQLGAVRTAALAFGAGLGLDDFHDPVADVGVFDLQPIKERDHLIVDHLLGQPRTRMARQVLLVGALVVREFLDRAVGELLADPLAGDDVPAVIAADHLAGERELRLVVDAAAELVLHSLERGQIDQRLELPRIPDAGVPGLADVVAVDEQVVERGSGEPGRPVGVDDALPGEGLGERIERELLVRVELEDPPHLGRVDRVGLDDAPAVDAHAAESVHTAERQAALNAAFQSRADVGGLLIGLVLGKDGAHATLHAAGGRLARGLIGEEERDAGLLGELFELRPVADVPGGAVHLDEEHATECLGVLPHVRDQLSECVAFLPLAGGLGDPVELDHGPAEPCREFQKTGLLVLQAKPFLLLLCGTDTRPRDKPFHAVTPLPGRPKGVPRSR